jgi:hypothetical protein
MKKLFVTPTPSFLVVTLVTAVTGTSFVGCAVTTRFFKVVTVVTAVGSASD